MMFATFTYAEVTFAAQDGTPAFPFPGGGGSGNFAVSVSRKKEYKTYTIFGKTYRLTEKEYEAYIAQRKAFEASIKDKTDDDLFDIVEDAYEGVSGLKHLADMIVHPIFTIKSLDIPLVDYQPDEMLQEVAVKRLLRINREKARLKAIADEKQRIQNLIDDEIMLEMILTELL